VPFGFTARVECLPHNTHYTEAQQHSDKHCPRDDWGERRPCDHCERRCEEDEVPTFDYRALVVVGLIWLSEGVGVFGSGVLVEGATVA